VKVGRCDLLLLDSKRGRERAGDLDTTSRLYAATPGFRIRQELLLGVGGYRRLRAMGISPAFFISTKGIADLRFEAIRSPHGGRGLILRGGHRSREVIFTTPHAGPAGTTASVPS